MMRGKKEKEYRIANGLSGATCDDGKKYDHWEDTGDDPYNASTSKYYTDPKQGCIDDCWFIAALVSVAWVANSKINTHPNYKFYDVGNKRWGDPFSINNELPVDATGNLVYARSNSGYIWPCLYEKAYAVWKANLNPHPVYENYLSGGRGANGLQTITGGVLGPKNTMPPFDALKRTKYPTVARTKDGAPDYTSNHDYSVLKKPSTTTYQLRDPCTCDIFTISTALFNANFEEWYYVMP